MMYAIEQDKHYLMHDVPAIESIDKLGDDYGTFAFNPQPIAYQSVWTPLHIQFLKLPEGKKTPLFPDISFRYGRLFVTPAACLLLKRMLEPLGELLPVTYEGGEGFLFNPLIAAESLQAVETDKLGYDEYGNLAHFSFDSAKLAGNSLFKTKLDGFTGLYCNESFKNTVESLGLKGIQFNPDLATPSGGYRGSEH